MAQPPLLKGGKTAGGESRSAPSGGRSPLSLPMPQGKPVKPAGGSFSQARERVPALERGFSLSAAMEKAFGKVKAYMEDILEQRDLVVRLESDGSEVTGRIVEKESGREVNSYAGEDMLRLYAKNRQEKGLIVDGNI